MKSKKNAWRLAGSLSLLLIGTGSSIAGEPLGLGIAPGVRVEPSFGARVWYTDNMYRTASEETDATALIFDPGLAFSYSRGDAEYRLGYQGQLAQFSTVEEDDYFDNEVFFTGDLALLARHRLELDARYKHGHDAFGSNRTQGLGTFRDRELDEWNETGLGATYTFGHPEARLNFYGRTGLVDRSYTTNETDPANPATGTRFLDYRSILVGGGAIYRLSARTKAVLDLEHQDIEYDVASNPRFDGDLQRALIGVRWMATAKTTGEFMVGHYARNFDASGRSDVSGIDWRARVLWNPRVHSQFTVVTGRLVRETYLLGENLINEQYAKLGWRQDWSSRFYSDAELGYVGDKYEGTARDDDYVTAEATVYFQLSRHIVLKGGVEHSQRDSSINGRDFDRNVIFQGFDVVF
jgi:hypothetical protein